MTTPRNREAWLTDFTRALLPYIRERDPSLVAKQPIKISVGFPSRGGTARKKRTIGQHWGVCNSTGERTRKYHQLFVHPQLVKPDEIGETIAHEILHALLPPGSGHRKPFSQAAKKVGLEGKPTATYAGEELKQKLIEIAESLGDYPHESLDVGQGKRRRDPNIKVRCPLCQYIARTTQVWLDGAGAPICPQCLVQMEEALPGPGEEGVEEARLFAINQTIEYNVRKIRTSMHEKPGFDPRWSLRMVRKGSEIDWFVIDYGSAIDPVTGHAVLGALVDIHPMVERYGQQRRVMENPYAHWHIDPKTGEPDYELDEEPLTPIFTPRVSRAESRDDALDLLERLRMADDPNEVYEELGLNDDDPELDKGDPFFEDEETLDAPSCPKCSGSGKVHADGSRAKRDDKSAVDCDECEGTGWKDWSDEELEEYKRIERGREHKETSKTPKGLKVKPELTYEERIAELERLYKPKEQS